MKNCSLKWLLNRNKKVGYKFSFVMALLAFFLLSACNNVSSINSSIVTPEQEASVLVESSATPEPTLLPTETFTPAPTATITSTPGPTLTPTEEVIEYVNWGFNPEKFTRYWIDKEGVIIPFNPVDNPEEFYREINRIANDSQKIEELGFIKYSKESFSGYTPALKRREIAGEIVVPFQIIFFKYKGENFPFIITDQNGNNNEVVLVYDSKYEEFIQNNIKGSDVALLITEEMTDEIVDSYRQNGFISSYQADLIKETGLSAGFLKALR